MSGQSVHMRSWAPGLVVPVSDRQGSALDQGRLHESSQFFDDAGEGAALVHHIKVPTGFVVDVSLIGGAGRLADLYLATGVTVTADGSALAKRNRDLTSSATSSVVVYENPTHDTIQLSSIVARRLLGRGRGAQITARLGAGSHLALLTNLGDTTGAGPLLLAWEWCEVQ